MPSDPCDYVSIQALLYFQCQRCGMCCQVADPIDIYSKDIRRLASYFNITVEEAGEEYAIPYPTEPDLRAFKSSVPCRFYNDALKGCRIYKGQVDGLQVQSFPEPRPDRASVEHRDLRGLPILGAESLKRIKMDGSGC